MPTAGSPESVKLRTEPTRGSEPQTRVKPPQPVPVEVQLAQLT